MLMPPAASPATAVNLSRVAIAPYCAGNTAASTGAGVVARIVASGSATTAYMRIARAASTPPAARPGQRREERRRHGAGHEQRRPGQRRADLVARRERPAFRQRGDEHHVDGGEQGYQPLHSRRCRGRGATGRGWPARPAMAGWSRAARAATRPAAAARRSRTRPAPRYRPARPRSTSTSPAAFFSTFSPTYRADSARIRSCPWNQPVVVVPRKMTNALTARASAAGVSANCAEMTQTTAPAMSPLPALAIIVNRVAAYRSASERGAGQRLGQHPGHRHGGHGRGPQQQPLARRRRSRTRPRSAGG